MPEPRRSHINADVRMRGFTERATVEAAIAWLDSTLPPFANLPIEEVGLREALGRVPASDVVSRVNVPSFARSMMDGYALRGEDTYGATPYNALELKVIGTCLPGEPFAGRVSAGEAVRIMTGAPLPAGADAVLPVEETGLDGNNLLTQGSVSTGKHVGQIGEDIRCGDVVVRAGRALRPQDIGVLSSIGCAQVRVICRPRVYLLITGNELLPAGSVPEGCRIADSICSFVGGVV
jgi:molybdopterin molybdotransferase